MNLAPFLTAVLPLSRSGIPVDFSNQFLVNGFILPRSLVTTILFVLTLAFAQAAGTNDNFGNRIRLEGSVIAIGGNNVGATREAGEPNHAGAGGTASLWWLWRPLEPGYVVIDTEGSDFDTTLGVYFGKDFATKLDPIGSNNNGTNGLTSRVDFDGDPQRDYSIAVDGASGKTGNLKLNIRLYTKPVIFASPQSQMQTEGGNATFSVDAVGKREDIGGRKTLRYQWRFKGADLAGETEPILTVRAVTKAQAGPYTVVVSNSYGAVTSSPPAVLTVNAAPQIVKQPVDLTPDPGDAVNLEVKVIGEEPLSFQWRYRPTLDAQDVELVGGIAATLPFSNISTDANGFYSVRVTNVAGGVTSTFAKVTVDPKPPKILELLKDQTVVEGTNVLFEAKARGLSPLSFKWFKDNIVIPGKGSSTLEWSSVTTNDTGVYLFEVSNRYGATRSNGARLTVEPRPPNDFFARRIDLSFETNVVYGFNKNGTNEVGETPHAGNLPVHSVWWSYNATNRGVLTVDLEKSVIDTVLGVYKGTNLTQLVPVVSNDDYIDNLTSSRRVASRAQFVVEPGVHYVFAVDGKGKQEADWTQNSGKGGLGIKVSFDSGFGAPFLISTLDLDFLLLGGFLGDGGGCGQANFVLRATSLVPWGYQWQFNRKCLAEGTGTTFLGLPCTPGDDWVNIPGATNDTLVFNPVTVEHTGFIRMIAANIGVAGAVTSAPTRVIVSPRPRITVQPNSFTARACERRELRFDANGGCYPVDFQWYQNQQVLVGETNKLLTFAKGLPANNGDYYAVARSKYGSVTSLVATVVFDATPVIRTQPNELGRVATECQPIRFVVDLDPSCLEPKFQWFRDGNTMAGATNSALEFLATGETKGSYFVQISNAYATNKSRVIRLDVDARPNIVEHPESAGPKRVLSGTTITNRVRVDGCSDLTFRWRKDGQFLQLDNRHVLLTNGFLVIRDTAASDSGRYDVVVSSATTNSISRSGEILVLQRPLNDDFAKRIQLTHTLRPEGRTNFYVSATLGTNFFGTAESGEPQHARQDPKHSVWWTWKSPTPSIVTLDLSGSGFDTLLGVYRGDSVDRLTTINFDDQGGIAGASRLTFLAASNKTFHIAVDGSRGEEGPITLKLTAQEIISPPIIRSHPRSVAATNGSTVTFSVAAFGSPDILYQWFFNGRLIPGATNENYSLTNVTESAEGNYTVSLVNDFGSTNSLIARLTFGSIIEGQVTDATNRRGIPNAKVSVGNVSTNTNEEGNYTLIGIRPGDSKAEFDAHKRRVHINEDVRFNNLSTSTEVTLRAEKDGFFPFEDARFKATAGASVTNKISMSPIITGFRFVANWGFQPADLDLHLLVPGDGGTNYHIQYVEADRGSVTEIPYALLDLDVRDSFGPETVTIYRLVDGVYQLYLKKFDPNALGSLSQSGATVRAYDSKGLYGVRSVPTVGNGSVWYVADYDSRTRSLTWRDLLLNSDPPPPNANRTPSVDGSRQGQVGLLAKVDSEMPLKENIPGATYFWEFGDGKTSTDVHPTNKFAAPGTYTVKLSLRLPGGIDRQEPKVNFITVYNELPEVELISPANNALYRLGMTIPLEARASDIDGKIRRVDFFRVLAGTTNKIGQSLEAPYRVTLSDLSPGKYTFIAQAVDDFDGVGTSKEVSVTVLDLFGDILIVRNFNDPEIDVLANYLSDLKLPDGPIATRPPEVRILDQEGLYSELIDQFKLIIWDDLGVLEGGITDSDVQLIKAAKEHGIALYMIGDHLGASVANLNASYDDWPILSQLGLPTGHLEPGIIEVPMDRPKHPLLGGAYGDVRDFAYDRKVESTKLARAENDTVGTRNGSPVLLLMPSLSAPDFGNPRTVIQDFLVSSGNDPESIEYRRNLFLNAAAWLLRLGECRATGLGVSAGRATLLDTDDPSFEEVYEPVTATAGEPMTIAFRVTQNGECTTSGVILTNTIHPSLEIQSVRVVPTGALQDTNFLAVRQGQELVVSFSKVNSASGYIVETTVIPRRGGTVTNIAQLFHGFSQSERFRSELPVIIEGAECNRDNLVLKTERRFNGEIVLHSSGAGCHYELRSTKDFKIWRLEAKSPTDGLPMRTTVNPDSETQRFYRLFLTE